MCCVPSHMYSLSFMGFWVITLTFLLRGCWHGIFVGVRTALALLRRKPWTVHTSHDSFAELAMSGVHKNEKDMHIPMMR
eukprot:m.22060 g.22060  ORF g.22060 m.22060 type:complete len:79 (-) comp12608_c0_seq3:457-693(-)